VRMQEGLDALEVGPKTLRTVRAIEPVAFSGPSAGEDERAATRPEHADDLLERVIDTSRVVEHAVRVGPVERPVREAQRGRVGDGHGPRPRACPLDAGAVDVDAPSIRRKETAGPAADIEDPASCMRTNDIRGPADGLSSLHRASLSTPRSYLCPRDGCLAF